MRLGIVYLVVCDIRDGKYTTAAPFARFVEALLPHFDDVRLMLPVSRDEHLVRAGYPLSENPKIEVVELPHISSLQRFFLDYHKHKSMLREAIKGCDLVNIRPPNFLSLIAGEECLRAEKPFFISLVGDYNDVIRDEHYTGWKKPVGEILRINHEARLRRLLGQAYAMVNGQGLYDKYNRYARKMEIITTTTISSQDFYQRDDTCLGSPVKILTVAVMQGYKGIPYLLDAASMLKVRGRDVRIDILGTGSRLEEYKAKSHELGLDSMVFFRGHVQYGPELFKYYHNADIFCLPSTGAEGTPRVVIEAMSQSLPVIITDVGGNASTVQGGGCGILLQPGDAKAMADAVEKLIDDGAQRREYIHKGYERAKDFTMDRHSSDLFTKLSREFPDLLNNIGLPDSGGCRG